MTERVSVMVKCTEPNRGSMFGGTTNLREHLNGYSWKFAKKGWLIVLNRKGKKIAVYKPTEWQQVWQVIGAMNND